MSGHTLAVVGSRRKESERDGDVYSRHNENDAPKALSARLLLSRFGAASLAVVLYSMWRCCV